MGLGRRLVRTNGSRVVFEGITRTLCRMTVLNFRPILARSGGEVKPI